MTSSSPATASPQKKRLAPSDTRRVSSSLTVESIRNAAVALGQSQKMESLTTSSQAALALPTPAKTPAHKHSVQSETNVNAIARNLFSKQQSPKKSRTKQYKLDSFEVVAEAEAESFQIYTDSHDRVPEPDAAGDNPFYGEAGIAASARPVRRSSRNKKNVVNGGVSELDEVIKRDDGLLYVFRGKKIFRKFTDGGEASSRPQVKPRLLFPSAKNNENDLAHTDEEAETDIEEPVQQEVDDAEDDVKDDTKDEVETPADAVEEKVDTPKAPKFAPASPPATSRATRSKKLIADEPTPVKAKRGGKRSPFDGWKRTKTASQSSVQGQKRAGEALSGASASKRTRV
ncbi:hypothetical protein VSDG_01350 [Cytospora chrysosperma]|uniref:Uncharacterized protein n=1 Tax=Cytospora chrysosperma TaxID=252740 RepID=A0A423WIU6_CYTCH|nr:hypothetical protein VSDG_01350 [Valsa sordida]